MIDWNRAGHLLAAVATAAVVAACSSGRAPVQADATTHAAPPPTTGQPTAAPSPTTAQSAAASEDLKRTFQELLRRNGLQTEAESGWTTEEVRVGGQRPRSGYPSAGLPATVTSSTCRHISNIKDSCIALSVYRYPVPTKGDPCWAGDPSGRAESFRRLCRTKALPQGTLVTHSFTNLREMKLVRNNTVIALNVGDDNSVPISASKHQAMLTDPELLRAVPDQA